MGEFTTKNGNLFRILKTESFEDFAEVVPKFGQGCNYETGKCVNGYQVDFDIEVRLRNRDKNTFHIIFQSIDRSDNIRAYSSSEMCTANRYGCDSDESEDLAEFTDYDEEIINILEEKAEILCKEWFDLKNKEIDE